MNPKPSWSHQTVNFFYSKKFMAPFLLFLVLFISKPILDLVIVDSILSKVKQSRILDGLFIIGNIFLVGYYIRLYRRGFRTAKITNLLIGSIGVVYIMFRFILVDVWFFLHVKWAFFSSLVYFDFILVIYVSHLIFLAVLKKNEVILKKPSVFSTNKSYKEEKKNGVSDDYNRSSASKILAEAIFNVSSEHAFAVGIVGEWGAGKTYFIEMLMEHIRILDSDNDTVVRMDFNPWRVKSSAQITEVFFSSLKIMLSKYNGELSMLLTNYINKIISADKTKVLEIAKTALSDEVTIEEDYKAVNKIISNLGKRIFVVIDDLDRLDESEIIEVIRLIRNNANFKNVFFIVGYDKEYVHCALKKINPHNHHSYLDKIFQVEKSLPVLATNLLHKNLKDLIEKQLKDHLIDPSLLKSTIDQLQGVFDSLDKIYTRTPNLLTSVSENIHKMDSGPMNTLLLSLRDNTKFANLFVLKVLSTIDEGLLIKELFVLELIQLKCFPLYSLLKQSPTRLLAAKTNVRNNGLRKTIYIVDNIKLDSFAKKYEDYPIDLLRPLLELLFPNNRDEKEEHPFSISVPKYYSIYFEGKGDISLRKFEATINGSYSNVENTINNWIKEKKDNDILDLFYGTNEFESTIQFENVFKSILYLYKKGIGYNLGDVIRRLEKDYLQDVIALYQDEESLVQYLLSEINLQDDISDQVYSQLQRAHLYKRGNPIVSLEKLQREILGTFKNHLSINTTIDEHAFRLYYNCIDRIDLEDDSKIYIMDEANRLFKEAILKSPNGFVNHLIRPLYTPSDGKTFTLEPFIVQIFGSYNSFEEFIEKCESTLPLFELKTFYKRFEQNSYQPIIFERGTIEFSSDYETQFLGSELSLLEEPRESEVFSHHWDKEILLRYPDFKFVSWIAGKYPIPKDEAITGGVYKFRRLLDLSSIDIDRIESAILRFFVDDKCSISINEVEICDMIETGEKTPFEKGVLNYLSDKNVIDITIRNKSAEEITEPDNINNIDGENNPYGIAYLITLRYKID